MNLWLLESKTKLLACEANCGGVDNRHQLLSVLCQQFVEKLLISLKQLNLGGYDGEWKGCYLATHHIHILVQGVR